MSGRSESERAELVALDPLEMLLDAARYAEGNCGKYSNPEWAKAARAAVAKARLADTGGEPIPVGGWSVSDEDTLNDVRAAISKATGGAS